MRVAVLAAIGLMLVAAVPLLAPSGAVADDVQVAISHPGVVFHKVGSEDLRGQGVVKTLEEAQSAGYLPCQVCFGVVKSAPAHALNGGLSTAIATRATVSMVHVGGPGRSTGTIVAQPFGQRAFGGHRGVARGSLKNPYDPLMTVRNPGKEQGAFGSDR